MLQKRRKEISRLASVVDITIVANGAETVRTQSGIAYVLFFMLKSPSVIAEEVPVLRHILVPLVVDIKGIL